MLDTIVGGGMSAYSTPIKTAYSESLEEASIAPCHLKKLKSCGAVMFINLKGNGLHLQTEFCYDLKLSDDFEPIPNDSEVEEFILMEIDELIARLLNNEFTPEVFCFDNHLGGIGHY
jgi:hypothetical protein